MHTLLPKYKRLYSRRLFHPTPNLLKATGFAQLLFYSSLFLQLALFPITFILLLYALTLRYKNPARTAGSSL